MTVPKIFFLRSGSGNLLADANKLGCCSFAPSRK